MSERLKETQDSGGQRKCIASAEANNKQMDRERDGVKQTTEEKYDTWGT